jgi:hypothetical protein
MFGRKKKRRRVRSTTLELEEDLRAGKPVEDLDPDDVSNLIEAVLAVTRESAAKAQDKLDRASKEITTLRLPEPGPTESVG